MESWREELYNTLSHSVEGSSWKDHKYVAIVDGKYIYPEDVQGMTTSKSSGDSDVDAAKTTYAAKNKKKTIRKATYKKGSKQKTYDGQLVQTVDKGSVANYKDLPEDPIEGDMYYLENTHAFVYWNGKIWTPVVESAEPKKQEQTQTQTQTTSTQTSSGVWRGSSPKKKSSKSTTSSGGLSKATLDKARAALKRVNLTTSNSGSSAKKSSGGLSQR